jgi:voltage-gated sodium channel
MVKGLASAIDSVWYILLLLVLLVYVYAVVGVILFAENDPANFNDVASAMLVCMPKC